MTYAALYRIAVILIAFLLQFVAPNWTNDFVALRLVVDGDVNFPLYYSQLPQWRLFVHQFSIVHGVDEQALIDYVGEFLKLRLYPESIVDRGSGIPSDKNDIITSIGAMMQLSDAAMSVNGLRCSNSQLLRPQQLYHHRSRTKQRDVVNSCTEPHTLSKSINYLLNYRVRTRIPSFLLSASSVTIYQSLGVVSGGTRCLRDTYTILHELGHNVSFCDENNQYSCECVCPSGLC
jgi:hypothetical protein